MARDTEHFYWVLVGIPRGEILDFYQAEAESFHETLPMHMRLLAVDRHAGLQGKGKGRWFPRDLQPAIQHSEPIAEIPDEEKRRTNASKAASVWSSTWDEDDEPTERLPIVRGV